MPVTVLRCESDHRDLSFFPPLSPQQRAWHININVLDAKLLQSCLTLCNPMDYSPAGFSVHGILQAMILEWVATAFSRGSS